MGIGNWELGIGEWEMANKYFNTVLSVLAKRHQQLIPLLVF